MMKRIFATCLLAVAVALGAAAQNAGDVLNKTIAAYKNVKGISASYVVTSSQGSNSGKIEMKGNKFRITSPDLMCWYDGTTQWAYSTSTGEVNVTEPTAEEMQMSNPYVSLTTLKKSCKIYKVNTKNKGVLVLKLVPKAKDQQVKHIMVYIKTDSYAVTNVNFEMTDGSYYRTTITNFKEAKHSNATFNYDSKAVPKGPEVVDLR